MMVTEVLSFYTPYADINRMEAALSTVLQEEITVMKKESQSFYLQLSHQEYLKIPFVSATSDPMTFQRQIQKLYASSAKLPCHNAYINQNLLYQIALFRAAYVFTFNYEENHRDEKILPLMEIADLMDALIFWETGDISDSYGDVILNKKGKSEVSVFNPVDGFDITNKALGLDEAAMKRIHHSLSVLRYKGIYAPTNIAPPFDDKMYMFQGVEEVSKRAVACMLLGVYSEFLMSHQGNAMLAYAHIEKMVRAYRASPFFTIREIEFLNERKPKQDDIQMYHSYFECAFTLLWILGLTDTLYFPSALCSNHMVMQTILDFESVEKMTEQAQMRTKEELLDALDLVQRYAWACKDAVKLGFQMPAGLLYDVVQLRHRCLTWVIGVQDYGWDEVRPVIESLRLKKKEGNMQGY